MNQNVSGRLVPGRVADAQLIGGPVPVGREILRVAQISRPLARVRVDELPPGVDHGDTDRKAVPAQVLRYSHRLGKAARIADPLDDEAPEKNIGGASKGGEMIRDDAGQILSVLRREPERGIALPHELIGNRTPNDRHDGGHGRHQLDPKLSDGYRAHGSDKVSPSRTSSRYASRAGESTEHPPRRGQEGRYRPGLRPECAPAEAS